MTRRGLNTTLREIYGLFVDDGVFAGAILCWLLLIRMLMKAALASAVLLVLLLFAGLAVILVESATRYARRRR